MTPILIMLKPLPRPIKSQKLRQEKRLFQSCSMIDNAQNIPGFAVIYYRAWPNAGSHKDALGVYWNFLVNSLGHGRKKSLLVLIGLGINFFPNNTSCFLPMPDQLVGEQSKRAPMQMCHLLKIRAHILKTGLAFEIKNDYDLPTWSSPTASIACIVEILPRWW